jgi:hypothetical protein
MAKLGDLKLAILRELNLRAMEVEYLCFTVTGTRVQDARWRRAVLGLRKDGLTAKLLEGPEAYRITDAGRKVLRGEE